ncbi:MAG: DNA helicase, partial [Gammaproteobacteria bacterium]|nr:DNA helicase [Gammaproteobacteria bacterium]
LAEGKRVLVVAEKIAALDGVYRRRRDVGLGEFCLELHSNKSKKLDVLSQLQHSWEAKGEIDTAEWTAKSQQLNRLREQLSTYVDRLHRRHSNGWSIHRAIGVVVAGDSQPKLGLRWATYDAHDEAAYAALRELADRLHANATAIGTDHLSTTAPLSPVHATQWSVRWQQELVQAAHTLHEASLAVTSTASALGENLGIQWPSLTHPVRLVLGVLGKALPHTATQPWAFCLAPNSERICAELATGSALLTEHRALSTKLTPAWPEALRTRLGHAIDLLCRYREIHAELGTPWPPTISDELERGVQHIEEIKQRRGGLSVKYGAGIAQINVVQLQRDWAKAEKSLWPMSWLGKRRARKALEAVMEGVGEAQVADDLDALVRIRSLEGEVESLNPGPATEGVWAGLKTRSDYARSALKANTALQAARGQRPFVLSGTTHALEGYCGDRWANDAKRLKALHAIEQQLSDCAPLSEPSHGLWRGHETDLDLLRAALAFEQAREALGDRGQLPTPNEAVAEGRCGPTLQAQHAVLQERAECEAQVQALSNLHTDCPGLWNGLDTDLEAIARATRFHELLKAGLAGLGESASSVRAALHHILLNRPHDLRPAGVLGTPCRQLSEQVAELTAAIDAFGSVAEQPDDVLAAFKEQSDTVLTESAARVIEAQPNLHAWCAWRHVQVEARSAGLAALAGAIETGSVPPADAVRALEVNYARWWLGEAVDDDEVLKRFVSAEHEQRIQAFRALDEEFTQVTRRLIRTRLCADLPSVENIHRTSEWGVLRHEMTKKRAHKPLRQLLQEIPTVVLKLAPCLLMSPLSIAQYLSADASNFDIVVFDEASQIPVWDAIGAMARA